MAPGAGGVATATYSKMTITRLWSDNGPLSLEPRLGTQPAIGSMGPLSRSKGSIDPTAESLAFNLIVPRCAVHLLELGTSKGSEELVHVSSFESPGASTRREPVVLKDRDFALREPKKCVVVETTERILSGRCIELAAGIEIHFTLYGCAVTEALRRPRGHLADGGNASERRVRRENDSKQRKRNQDPTHSEPPTSCSDRSVTAFVASELRTRSLTGISQRLRVSSDCGDSLIMRNGEQGLCHTSQMPNLKLGFIYCVS